MAFDDCAQRRLVLINGLTAEVETAKGTCPVCGQTRHLNEIEDGLRSDGGSQSVKE